MWVGAAATAASRSASSVAPGLAGDPEDQVDVPFAPARLCDRRQGLLDLLLRHPAAERGAQRRREGLHPEGEPRDPGCGQTAQQQPASTVPGLASTVNSLGPGTAPTIIAAQTDPPAARGRPASSTGRDGGSAAAKVDGLEAPGGRPPHARKLGAERFQVLLHPPRRGRAVLAVRMRNHSRRSESDRRVCGRRGASWQRSCPRRSAP